MGIKLFLLESLLFLVAASAVATADKVIITQVLYDPLGTDSGGEAVELYNPTALPIDVSGWVISTETSPSDATIPANTILNSGRYYLIADAGWSASRDDLGWPLADLEEAITLANTDAGVALSNGTHTIDAVGWGSSANIGANLYEGAPNFGSGNGKALLRLKNGTAYTDTNDNSNDFNSSAPNFRNSSFGESYGTSTITVIAVVEGSFPAISNFKILTDDDASTDGNQVNPVPKKNKTVEVEAIVAHDNGNEYIGSAIIAFNSRNFSMAKTPINSTAAKYSAKINMSYSDSPGNYTLQLSATDNSGFSANSTAAFEYSELVAIELDTATLQFAAMPGKSSEIIGDANAGTSTNATIQNIGNSVLDLQISGTNLSSGSSMLSANSILYTFNGNYNNSLAGSLAYAPETKAVALSAASALPVSFKLSIPTATAPGNYTGKITIVAIKS